jgi:hypothetical protein
VLLAGLDWIRSHLKRDFEHIEDACQQALRLYRNISAADPEAVEEGLQELHIILYQLWGDASMLSRAFEQAQPEWQQQPHVQQQQQLRTQSGPLAEAKEAAASSSAGPGSQPQQSSAA